MGGQLEKRGAAAPQAQGRRLVGYAAVFNQPAQIDGRFEEIILKGAFTASLQARKDILALSNHNADAVLGRTSSGTLRLWEDEKGLAYEIDLPDTTEARDLLALAERKDLGGMSIGFFVPDGGERRNGRKRELRRVDLVEVSVVSSFPAYSGTSVEARAKAPRLSAARRFLETV